MPSTRESGRKVEGETEYRFSEKQAILRVAPSAKAGREIAALLREALRKKLPVQTQIDAKKGLI